MSPQSGPRLRGPVRVEAAADLSAALPPRLGRGAGAAVPRLDAAPRSRDGRRRRPGQPRRMFGICNNLGVLPKPFFPEGTGRDYTPSPYLKLLEEHRDDFTVLSGVSHPIVDGGHPSDISFLTAAPHPASSSFRNSISLDQLVAEQIGTLTRFPSLTLAVNGGRSLSWTRTGVAIPPEGRASEVFNQLFLQGTPAEVERQIREIDTGRSILDVVAEQARDLQRDVGARDRGPARPVLFRASATWSTGSRSRAAGPTSRSRWSRPARPIDPASPAQYMAKVQVMYDLARLAFETDSTRAITLMLNSVGTPVVQIAGATITDSYHNLSHHGKAEDKLAQLKVHRRMAHEAARRPVPGL